MALQFEWDSKKSQSNKRKHVQFLVIPYLLPSMIWPIQSVKIDLSPLEHLSMIRSLWLYIQIVMIPYVLSALVRPPETRRGNMSRDN